MRRAALAGWLALAAGCAPPDGARAELTMGTETAGFPAVVALVLPGEPPTLACSGTLISEHVVLTAAHCVPRGAPGQIEVFFGSDLRRAGTRVPAIAAVAHPDASESADHDLALVLLAEPAGVAPLRLASDDAIAAAPPVSVRLVGYGLTAPGAGDDVVKREGRSLTTEVTPLHVVLGADPSLPCRGDSGGPVLVSTPAGERVGGVVSRGDAACTERARATRVDAHLDDFLTPALAAWAPGSLALGDPCLYDAHCASGRCAEALDEPLLRFCAAPCAADAECDAPLSCQEALCRYPTPSPGAVGAPCASRDDCARGDCLDGRGTCSVRCVSGRGDCPTGFACEHLGGIDFYCVPPPPPGGCEACASARPSPAGPAAWGAALVAVAFRRRRPRRAGRALDSGPSRR
ncbi:MAG: trypsin-like serine protease [Sandaracinaceae bacterium]|nr:trypsin-like serine protease [Sandaracinaceae bacterium]